MVFSRHLLVILLLGRPLSTCALSFGLLNGGSAYFEPIPAGFLAKCQSLGVTCYTRVSNGSIPCAEERRAAVNDFLALNVSGIAMKPCGDANREEMLALLEETSVPIVTFDSDVPDSSRIAYVGTDNWFLGRTMARLLRQLRPEGGTYATILRKTGRTEGFVEEIEKYNDRNDRGHWHEVERNFSLEGKETDNMYLLESYAQLNPDAIITMTQSPMRHPNWTEFVDRHRHQNITFIGADGADYQLSYLNRRYVDGLVGQLPYEIGSVSFNVLYDYVTKGSVPKDFYPTNVVAYNLIPLELPPLDVDENLVGHLKYVGVCCFGLVVVVAIYCVAWTIVNRKCAIVMAAQPFFLIMIAAGVLIMAGSLIPLSFDDNGDPEDHSENYNTAICMSPVWLAFTGFTVTFSALFSKTWRVNRLFHGRTSHMRVKVTEKDVLGPFVLLLVSNFAVLITWTIVDPLTYARQENEGTDYWNRVISTYGSCQSDSVIPYIVPLALMNFLLICFAGWQALQARDIRSEFSESKYIGLTVGSLFQAFLTGIPAVVVVRDLPQAFYVVLSVVIFILCMVVLLLIFLPKMLMHRCYAGKSEAEQRRMIGQRIEESARSFRPSSADDHSSSFKLSPSVTGVNSSAPSLERVEGHIGSKKS